MMHESESTSEPGKSGHHLLDIVVGCRAISMSLCSLGPAIPQRQTIERLVGANACPFVEFDTSNGKLAPNREVTRELTVQRIETGPGANRMLGREYRQFSPGARQEVHLTPKHG